MLCPPPRTDDHSNRRGAVTSMQDPTMANAIGWPAALRQAPQRHATAGAHHGCATAGGSDGGVRVAGFGLAVSSFAVALQHGRPPSQPDPGIQSPAGSLLGARRTLLPGSTGSASWPAGPLPGASALPSRPAAAPPPGPGTTTGGSFGGTSRGALADPADGDSSGGRRGGRTGGGAAFWCRGDRRGPGHQPGHAGK